MWGLSIIEMRDSIAKREIRSGTDSRCLTRASNLRVGMRFLIGVLLLAMLIFMSAGLDDVGDAAIVRADSDPISSLLALGEDGWSHTSQARAFTGSVLCR